MVIVREDLEYVGIDRWDRPVFRHKNGKYYCSTSQLLSEEEATEDRINDVLQHMSDGYDSLYLKGSSFEGEPSHSVPYKTTIEG